MLILYSWNIADAFKTTPVSIQTALLLRISSCRSVAYGYPKTHQLSPQS